MPVSDAMNELKIKYLIGGMQEYPPTEGNFTHQLGGFEQVAGVNGGEKGGVEGYRAGVSKASVSARSKAERL